MSTASDSDVEQGKVSFPPHAAVRVPGIDFSRIPECFAPPDHFNTPPGTDTSSCMDHPDIPSGLKLPKKKKKPSKVVEERPESRFGGLLSRSQPRDKSHQTTSLGQHYDAGTAQNRSSDQGSVPARTDSLGYSWNVRSSEDSSSSGPGRKLSLLSTRKSKPQNLDQVPKRQHESLSAKFKGAKHPDVTIMESRVQRKPVPPPQPSPREDFDSASRSNSQPSTPSWIARGHRRMDEQMRYTEGGQALQTVPQQQQLQVQDYPPQQHPGTHPHQEPEIALFAAATSGLSPEQAQSKWNPLPPVPPIPATHVRHSSSSSNRHHSTSSSSAHSMPLPVDGARPGETQDALRAYQSLTGLPKSAPDLPATKNVQPQQNVFPPGHPLARWATQSSISSRGSGASIHESIHEGPPQRPERPSSRSFEVPRLAVSPLSPEPPPNYPSSRHSRSSTDTRPSAQSRSLDITRTTLSRPVSPADDMPWLQKNVSALTVDTTVSPHSATFLPDISNPRHSAVSAIGPYEDVSPIDECELSPIDPSELPDYATSQEETQRKRQLENERRAQELQRRWMASTGGR